MAFPLSVSVSVPQFTVYEDTNHWTWAHPDEFILTCSSAQTLFPGKVPFTGTGGEDFNIFWGGGGHNSTHKKL